MKKLIGFIFLAGVFTSCQYQRNNTIDQDDFHSGDERIYGVSPDSSARQLKVKYTPNPDLAKRADKIREKLYN